jgi:predicted DNA-binding transcriptional regulator AlpA
MPGSRLRNCVLHLRREVSRSYPSSLLFNGTKRIPYSPAIDRTTTVSGSRSYALALRRSLGRASCLQINLTFWQSTRGSGDPDRTGFTRGGPNNGDRLAAKECHRVVMKRSHRSGIAISESDQRPGPCQLSFRSRAPRSDDQPLLPVGQQAAAGGQPAHHAAGYRRERCGGSLAVTVVAGEMLSVSRRSLQRLQSRGAIPTSLRVGGAVRWRLDAVEESIQSGCDPIN